MQTAKTETGKMLNFLLTPTPHVLKSTELLRMRADRAQE